MFEIIMYKTMCCDAYRICRSYIRRWRWKLPNNVRPNENAQLIMWTVIITHYWSEENERTRLDWIKIELGMTSNNDTFNRIELLVAYAGSHVKVKIHRD